MTNERNVVITDPTIIAIIEEGGLDPTLINRARIKVARGRYTDDVTNPHLEFERYLKEQGKISGDIKGEQAEEDFSIPYQQPQPPSEETILGYHKRPLSSQLNISLTDDLGNNHEPAAEKQAPIIQQLINLSQLIEDKVKNRTEIPWDSNSELRHRQRVSQNGTPNWRDIIVAVIPENTSGQAHLSISYHEIQFMEGEDGEFDYFSTFSLKVAFYSDKIEIVKGKKIEPQFTDIKKGVTYIISLDEPIETREKQMLITQATKVLEAYLAGSG